MRSVRAERLAIVARMGERQVAEPFMGPQEPHHHPPLDPGRQTGRLFDMRHQNGQQRQRDLARPFIAGGMKGLQQLISQPTAR
jgi:hypothetical protein